MLLSRCHSFLLVSLVSALTSSQTCSARHGARRLHRPRAARTSIEIPTARVPLTSATSSSTAPGATASPPPLAQFLNPLNYNFISGFTTASDVSIPGLATAPLSDEALNVFKVSKGKTHNVVQQDGKTAWEAVYPKGSCAAVSDPQGGFGFYVNGTDEFRDAIADGAKEVMFGYSVFFEAGFKFNIGGKLPGGFGGLGNLAYACSGGRQEDRDKCFDLRLMWRGPGKDGLNAGELYAYLPPTTQNSKAVVDIKPVTLVNPVYGTSIGRGAFSFRSGVWTTVAERIKLNDPPSASNGEVELFIDGKSVILVQGLSLRTGEDVGSVIKGMQFQTFFGGSTEKWASPKDQKAYFADITGAVISGGK